jgi:two-component system sensor histidine kinase KdpD
VKGRVDDLMPWARRTTAGVLVALGGSGLLSALMIALRSHLAPATPPLVLVVPVVAATVIGGPWAGGIGAGVGFLSYDLFFIPPYYSLSVKATQNWVALAVYLVVMLLTSRVVVFMQRAQAEAARRETHTRQLYLLSDFLIGDRTLTDLLEVVATTIQRSFDRRWVAVLLPSADGLEIVTTAGAPLSDTERREVMPVAGQPQRLGTGSASGGITSVALTATNRPVGLLAMAGGALDTHEGELLITYANHAAVAIERSQLRLRAMRTELLEEVDRWRDALMGAVSHDLRTPLASVKTAVSTLRRSDLELSRADRDELLELIEHQSDRLDRLVANLLDMTRIQAGALVLRPEVATVAEVIDEALRALATVGDRGVVIDLSPDLPLVEIDQILMAQVFANLLDNALRHSPNKGSVEVGARVTDGVIEVWVQDHGPGIAPEERDHIFEMFNRVSGSGRAGLGLTIARSFVEAHGQSIQAHDVPGGGARFTVTLPTAAVPAEVV